MGSGIRSGPGHLAVSSPVIHYATDVQPQIWAWGTVSAPGPLLRRQTQQEAESGGGEGGNPLGLTLKGGWPGLAWEGSCVQGPKGGSGLGFLGDEARRKSGDPGPPLAAPVYL